MPQTGVPTSGAALAPFYASSDQFYAGDNREPTSLLSPSPEDRSDRDQELRRCDIYHLSGSMLKLSTLICHSSPIFS